MSAFDLEDEFTDGNNEEGEILDDDNNGSDDIDESYI